MTAASPLARMRAVLDGGSARPATLTLEEVVRPFGVADRGITFLDKVSFAGPYYVAGQDLLVRADESAITGPDTMAGKKICSVSGSTPAKRIKTDYPQAKLQEFDAYSKCVAALIGKSVDAVSTDDIILAGYAAQYAGQLKVVGKPFSKEPYGIGLAKDDKLGRDAINDALQKIFTDGRYKAAWDATLGTGGTPAPTPPALDRY
jgi:glutamate transport system substrate-binding protein